MWIIATSDTHRRVENFKPTPREDVILVHAGDACMMGDMIEYCEFLDWYGKLPARAHLYVPGNHDFICEQQPHLARELALTAGVTILDGEAITIDDRIFYGAPWVTKLPRWAFNREEEWIYDRIKKDFGDGPGVDVLISHAPAYGHLDEVGVRYGTNNPHHVGSHAIARIVDEYNPVYHIHGHIHEGYGVDLNGMTGTYNVAMCDEHYAQTNPPILLDI